MEVNIKVKLAQVDGGNPDDASARYVQNLFMLWLQDMAGADIQVTNPGTGDVAGEFSIQGDDDIQVTIVSQYGEILRRAADQS